MKINRKISHLETFIRPVNLTPVNVFFHAFFYNFLQTMFRPNRNKTVSGFFLAGRHMWWLPVSYYLREKILFSPESCPLQKHDLHSWWDVIFEGFSSFQVMYLPAFRNEKLKSSPTTSLAHMATSGGQFSCPLGIGGLVWPHF